MPNIPSSTHPWTQKCNRPCRASSCSRTKNRWTMETLTNCEWLKTKPTQNSRDSHVSTGSMGDAGQVWLHQYQGSQPMPLALAVAITSRNHWHLIGMSLGDLRLGKDLGVTVLLIKKANGTFEKLPGAETKIMFGDWMYFGMPQGKGFSDAADGLELKLRGGYPLLPRRQSSGQRKRRFRPLKSRKRSSSRASWWNLPWNLIASNFQNTSGHKQR